MNRQANAPRYVNLPSTAKEFFQLEDDKHRYELVDGTMVLIPSPFYTPQRFRIRACLMLEEYFSANPIGIYAPDVPCVLSDHEVRWPDLVVVLEDRHHQIGRYVEGAPNLVVEIVGCDQLESGDFRSKMTSYRIAGVEELWLIERDTRTIEGFVNQGAHWAPLSGVPQAQSVVLPGFAFNLDRMFPQ